MTDDPRRWLLLALVTTLTVQGQTSPQDRKLTAPATPGEIASLIRDLNDRVYRIRTAASRRLCAIGRPAEKQLREAADSGAMETALRAKAVLGVIDQLLFSGVEVALRFSKTQIRWNEPVELTLSLHNPTPYPARVHFDLSASTRATNDDEVRQVTTMLDTAEWLSVMGPDGKALDLVVDDIAADPSVHQAVLELMDKPVTNVLEPGERTTIHARMFNRGWARYPLLDGGAYTVSFDYTPEWKDAPLARAKAGRVVSKPVSIRVIQAAPSTISRHGLEVEITLEREGAFLVVRLINRRDVSVCMNKNFGPTAPFARGSWVYERLDRSRQVPVGPVSGASWRDFDERGLVTVEPGGRAELTRIAVKNLLASLKVAGARLTGDNWTIQFSYMNLTDRSWQRRADRLLMEQPTTPAVLRKPLPRRMVTSRHLSNRLPAPR